MQRVNAADAAQRFEVTIDSILADYQAGKLSKGTKTATVKRLDDDHDPEKGLSHPNLMRLLAARMEMQGYLLYFDPEVVRNTLLGAIDRVAR